MLLLVAVLLGACEHTPSEPRAAVSLPPGELAAQVLALELRTEELRSLCRAQAGRSFGEDSVDALEAQLAVTAALLLSNEGSPDDEQRAAAEIGLNAAGLYADLVAADLLASVQRVRAITRSHCNDGTEALNPIMVEMANDWRWALANREKAWEGIATARRHRDQVKWLVPATSVMKAGVAAANSTGAALSLIRLVRTGLPALAQLVEWLKAGGYEGAGLELAGAGSGLGVQAVAGARVLALGDAAVIALAQTGQVAANVVALLYMARGHLHHICTDKNFNSNVRGGPWSPRFKRILDGAKLRFDDPENLVEVEGHQGPHPEKYHVAVMQRLERATIGQTPGTAAYRQAVIQTLRALAEEIKTPGSSLNLQVTGAAR